MRKKVYIVELTDAERQHLRTFIHGGTTQARMINRAQILLHADEGKGDDAIAAALHPSASTVWRIRKRFTEDGLDGALHEIVRPCGARMCRIKRIIRRPPVMSIHRRHRCISGSRRWGTPV
jgi:hypothetical protein